MKPIQLVISERYPVNWLENLRTVVLPRGYEFRSNLLVFLLIAVCLEQVPIVCFVCFSGSTFLMKKMRSLN